jgi:hypothetical protein
MGGQRYSKGKEKGWKKEDSYQDLNFYPTWFFCMEEKRVPKKWGKFFFPLPNFAPPPQFPTWLRFFSPYF